MDNNISFTIQNSEAIPKNAPDLFIGQDSTLVFVFTIPKSLGITELDKGDLFTIIIPNTLLTSADNSNLADLNWEVTSLTQPSENDQNFTFVLTPKSAITVNNYEVSITFKKLQGTSQTNGEVSTQYKIQGSKRSGSSEKLFVVDPPNDNHKNLLEVVRFTAYVNDDQQFVRSGLVYISPGNLQPPIPNRVHVNLAFSGQNLGSNGSASNPPKFLFSFSYGSSFNDLTDAIKVGDKSYNALTSAWSIVASIKKEETQWKLEDLNTSNNTPIWVVKPASGTNIFAQGPGLDLHFDQIITILPKGVAYVYIQWANIPGYNDGATALSLEKRKPQAKLTLASPQDEKTIGPKTPVTLNWTAFAVKNLEITWDSGNQSKLLTAYNPKYPPQLIYSGSDNTIVPDSPVTDFLLNANFDANGNGSIQSNTIKVRVSDFPAPTITQFSAGLEKDASGNVSVALSWLVENLGEGGYFILNNGDHIDGTKYNGHLYTYPNIPVDPSVPFENTFTLEAVGSNGLTTTETIQATIPDWYAPEITDFTGEFKRDGGTPTSLLLTFKVKNAISIKNNSDASTKCQISDWSITLNDQGVATLSIHIDNTKPEFSLQTMLTKPYILTVTNPNGQWDKKSTKVQFEKTKTIIGTCTDHPKYEGWRLALNKAGTECFAFFYPGPTNNSNAYVAKFDPTNVPTNNEIPLLAMGMGGQDNPKLLAGAMGQKIMISDFNWLYFRYYNGILACDLNSVNWATPIDMSTLKDFIGNSYSYTSNENPVTSMVVFVDSSGDRDIVLATNARNSTPVSPDDICLWLVWNAGGVPTIVPYFDEVYLPTQKGLHAEKLHFVDSAISQHENPDERYIFIVNDEQYVFFRKWGDYYKDITPQESTTPPYTSIHPFTGYWKMVNGEDQCKFQAPHSVDCAGGWVYWIGQHKDYPTKSILYACEIDEQKLLGANNYTTAGEFYPDSNTKKVVASDCFVFVVNPYIPSPSNNLQILLAKQQFKNDSSDILQNLSVNGLQDLVVMPDNTRILVACEDGIEVWEAGLTMAPAPFIALPGSQGEDIAVSDNGDLWFTNEAGTIFKWNGKNDWIPMSGEGVGYRISAGGGQEWYVTKSGNIVHENVYSWGLKNGARDIAVSDDGSVWFTNEGGTIYKWDGKNDWISMSGEGKGDRISAGGGQVWVVNNAGNISRFNKVSKGWDPMPGAGRDIAVSNDGTVWVTNSEGLLYKWDGATWIQHDFVGAKNISANNGNLFVVGSDGYIYKLS